MATKYQRITGVYESTIGRVTQAPAAWTAFATSDIAENCLREISATVINLQRQEKNQNRTFAIVRGQHK